MNVLTAEFVNPECPADAIPSKAYFSQEAVKWEEPIESISEIWSNITEARSKMYPKMQKTGMENHKYEEHFSENRQRRLDAYKSIR